MSVWITLKMVKKVKKVRVNVCAMEAAFGCSV